MTPRLLPRMLLGMSLLLLAACQTMADHGGWTRAQIAALRSDGFVKTPRGWEFGMQDRLLFATDESDIRPEQVTIIRRITGEAGRGRDSPRTGRGACGRYRDRAAQ